MTDTQESPLAAAFVRMQAELPQISLDASVSFKNVKFHYATLSNILHSTRPVLAKHGLAVVQQIGMQDGHVKVTTTLLHSSGGQLSSDFQIKPQSQEVKEIGSTITYARRYAVAALLGIAIEGDYDAEVLGERYTGTETQKDWLRGIFKDLGITDHSKMRAAADVMIRENREMKYSDVVEVLEKMR